MDWLAATDFKTTLSNYHYDLVGDWYRDPWGWPEVGWVLKKRPDLIVARLNESGVRTAALIDVPKENFATRPALVFDPIDRFCYQAIVDALSVGLIGDLPRWVYGARLARNAPARGVYTIKSEWKWYRARIRKLAEENRYALLTDIVSFFASVPIARLNESLHQRVHNEMSDRLSDMVTRWSDIAGRPGVQQRSLASSVLANVYVRPLDDLLAAEGLDPASQLGYGRALRWTDDITLFGNDAGGLRRAQTRIEAVLRDLGLNMGTSKTRILEGSELREEAFRLELGYIDIALEDDNPAPLEALVERLVARPEAASRTAIRFAGVRVRKLKRADLAKQFAEVADRMPQGADHIARMLRELGLWETYVPWYLSYCRSPWACVEWSPAQFGTMFPSDSVVPATLVDFFAEQLGMHRSLPYLALLAQRLASWRPAAARGIIRDLAKKTSHPLERRVLALAALAAGEDRNLIRSFLAQFEENKPTLLMLQAVDFRVPPTVPDYAGR